MTTSPELGEAESDGELPGPFQVQSYEGLLQFPTIPFSTINTPSGKRAITEPLLDAIVVPTVRTAEHLRPAVQFATDAQSQLIVVYTDNPPAGLAAALDAGRRRSHHPG